MSTGFPDTHPSGVPYGRLEPNLCKEQISITYAHAVATAARCKLDDVKIDDHGVDAVLLQTPEDYLLGNVRVDVQLKCTSMDVLREDHVAFPLPRFNYDSLRGPKRLTPAILVVMIVPPRIESWLAQDEDSLRLVKCAYWMSLRGAPAIDQQGRTVHVPRANIFDVSSLLAIMKLVAEGGHP